MLLAVWGIRVVTGDIQKLSVSFTLIRYGFVLPLFLHSSVNACPVPGFVPGTESTAMNIIDTALRELTS